MRHFFNLTFPDIATRLDLKPRAAQAIYQRAAVRALPATGFKEIAACAGSLDRAGRPPIITEGTPASIQLRSLFAEHYELDFETVAHQLYGFKVARSTLERIAHDHYTLDPLHPTPLVRRVQTLKPALSLDHKDLRMEFSTWALREVRRHSIFIFTDETSVEFGAQTGKKGNITRPKGHPDPDEFAGHTGPPQFKLML